MSMPRRVSDLARQTIRLARHLRRDAARGLTAGHLLEDGRRFLRQGRRGGAVSWPPHPLTLYEDALVRLLESGACGFLSLEAHVKRMWADRDRIAVVLRHDVDAGNARNTAALCEVDARLKLPSSVHLLVDDALYPAKSVAALGRDLRAAGVDVGLHTQAWMHADYSGAFRADVARFGDVLQFPPKTMTLHGAWPRSGNDLARRRRFLRDLPGLLEGTPLVGYDNDFDWVSEDSNVQGRPSPITASFFAPDRYCYLGGVALILTHDAHWAPAA